VLVGHPLDLVKVRQQTDDESSAVAAKGGRKKKSKSTFRTLVEIVEADGIGGLYRGIAAPLVAVAPIWATSFWGFDTGDKLVRLLCKNSMKPGAPLNIWQLCVAGGFSALPTALVMVPSERIKCILQIQQQNKKGGGVGSTGKKKHYDGFRDCARQLYAESGVRGLYKGTALTLMRDIPGNMVYFGVYEVVRRTLVNNQMSTSSAALIAGAFAGIGFWPGTCRSNGYLLLFFMNAFSH